MKAQKFFAEGKRLKKLSRDLMVHGSFDQYEKTKQKLDVWNLVKEEMQEEQSQEQKQSKPGYKKHDRVFSMDRFGHIYRVHRDGTYDIRYDDGQTEKSVGHNQIRKILSPRRFRLRDRVMARFHGGKRTYPGTIAKAHRDGTYSIDYDDGDFEEHVPVSRIGSSFGSDSSLGSPSLRPTSSRGLSRTPSRKLSITSSPATKSIKASRPRPREEKQTSCSVM